MAKPNYQFEKRQRDLAKKQKQEEKRRQKLAKGASDADPDTAAPLPPEAPAGILMPPPDGETPDGKAS